MSNVTAAGVFTLFNLIFCNSQQAVHSFLYSGTFCAGRHCCTAKSSAQERRMQENGSVRTPLNVQPSLDVHRATHSTADERQFARFLEAANQLGENLDISFDAGFMKIVSSAPKDAYRQESQETAEPIFGDGSPLIEQLHFAEAMMMLMFNVLNETQQESIKQHFGPLLKKCENLKMTAGIASASASRSKQFEGFAECCLELARSAKTPARRARFVQMAHEYGRAQRGRCRKTSA